ncbi:efflux RND transporter periplasmic adaptor subunit [Pseudodesulfovibrio cashew]|uniref:Efflux RND transporter periplasmic adaptor subunit n=1 Tax=Pseudodesulfovibrio cashew TaxID=2678688 RepID=A0A6I6JC17_9BACT|nr:efflux RND transporter periplasmic adaptor subunit [Pseudodesulfovibrio cashew]QGY40325.1 efflux RND transporter periplasmic adaptor subunit [Pseudodesulfovibrio cashew]
MKFLIPVTLLLCLLLASCNDAPKDVVVPVRPVKTTVVDSSGLGRRWTFSGTAEDALETDLSFRVAGKIVYFPGDQIGRRFAEGEVIAKLDPSDFELALRQARANLEQVRANYTRAEADMRRNSELFKRNVISRGELDQIQADFKSYEAQLSATSKQLDISRKQLSYTTLHAPFDGWIGRVQTNIHQNVSAGQPVVSFSAGRQMKMYIAVPDTLISEVHEGDPVEVRFDALPGHNMHGKIMEVSVDTTTGSSYPVKVHLENEKQLVKGGMSGYVSFLGKAEGGPVCYLPPVSVVGESDGTRAVWVVDTETSTVKRRSVVVGKLTSLGLEILGGVKQGDVVVTRGVHHLKDGLKVRYSRNGTEG